MQLYGAYIWLLIWCAERGCRLDAFGRTFKIPETRTAANAKKGRECMLLDASQKKTHLGAEDGPPAGRFAPNRAATERWLVWKRFAEDKLQGLWGLIGGMSFSSGHKEPSGMRQQID